MTRVRITLLLALLSITPGALCAAPPESLTRFRCYTCHSDRESLAGPAFADVAASYRAQTDAIGRIANQIRSGMRSGGPWHMPPHPEVSVEEARAMARYIMSLAPKPATTKQDKLAQ